MKTSVGSFTIGGGANLKADAGLFVTGGSTIAAVDATATVAGNVNYMSSAATNFPGTIAGAGKTLTLNNAAAVLTLSGPSTYTGATMVTSGTLRAGITSIADASGAFGEDSVMIMADSANAALDLAGFDTQIGSLTGGGMNGGNVTLGSATLALVAITRARRPMRVRFPVVVGFGRLGLALRAQRHQHLHRHDGGLRWVAHAAISPLASPEPHQRRVGSDLGWWQLECAG